MDEPVSSGPGAPGAYVLLIEVGAPLALEAGGSSSLSLLSDRTRAKPNSAGTWAKYASVLDALGGARARRRPGGEAERMCLNRSFQGVY